MQVDKQFLAGWITARTRNTVEIRQNSFCFTEYREQVVFTAIELKLKLKHFNVGSSYIFISNAKQTK